MHPYLAAFLKMLECSERENVGETKQLKQKLLGHYNDHIFLSMLKGVRTLFAFALEMWFSTSSMKNYNPLKITLKTKLSGLYKLSQKLYVKFRKTL